jgi:hypothetical protein
LGSWAPDDPELYRQRGKMVACDGYIAANLKNLSLAKHDLVSK